MMTFDCRPYGIQQGGIGTHRNANPDAQFAEQFPTITTRRHLLGGIEQIENHARLIEVHVRRKG